MWSTWHSVPKFTGRTVGTERRPLTSDEELDILRDREAWIARLYEYGYPFLRGDQYKENTVYVHVSEDKPFSQFTGAKLTAAEEAALTMFGVAPEGMTVIYTDKNGIPLPSDQKPRFYERAMQGLDAAEKQIEKLIADHDALFQQEPMVSPQKTEDGAGGNDIHIHIRIKNPTHSYGP